MFTEHILVVFLAVTQELLVGSIGFHPTTIRTLEIPDAVTPCCIMGQLEMVFRVIGLEALRVWTV